MINPYPQFYFFSHVIVDFRVRAKAQSCIVHTFIKQTNIVTQKRLIDYKDITSSPLRMSPFPFGGIQTMAPSKFAGPYSISNWIQVISLIDTPCLRRKKCGISFFLQHVFKNGPFRGCQLKRICNKRNRKKRKGLKPSRKLIVSFPKIPQKKCSFRVNVN